MGAFDDAGDERGRRLDKLAGRARRGDRSALAELIELDYDRLHAICWKVLRDDEAALDAAQEAAVAVARGIRRFEGDSRYTTWAYRIALNAALDEVRRRKRRPVVSLDGNPPDERPDDSPGEAEGLVESMSIRQALEHLPEEQRTVLILRHDFDLDYEEIARVLRAPVGTVRSRISRGRAALRTLLEGAEGDDDSTTMPAPGNERPPDPVEEDATS